MTVRSAMRSRMVMVLLSLLVLAIIGIPLTVKGDGTLSGHVQLLLTYTLGFATLILAVETIWVGCAAVSSDVQDRQMQMVTTKPVNSLQIWFGKWLGILVLNALLLTFAGLVTYGLLRWTTQPGKLTDQEQYQLREQILVARRQVLPAALDVDEPARQIVEERKAAGALPPDVPLETVYEAVKERLLVQANTVPSGVKRRWIFRLSKGAKPNRTMFLRYKLTTSEGSGGSATGIWLSGPEADAGASKIGVTSASGGVYTIPIPETAVGPDNEIVIEYANINPTPITVFFPLDDSVQLLVYEDSFEWNYLRALLVVFCQLAFLGAVGLAAGSVFSMPVAAFTSAWIVLLIGIGDHLQVMAGKDAFFTRHGSVAEPGVPDMIFRGLFKALSSFVQPLQGPNPLELLSVGQLVNWALVAGTFLIKVGIYSVLLAMLSSWVLSRREIGLQQ
jgi:hypothetical protein